MVRPAGLDHGPPRARGDAGPLEQGGFARFCGASERVEIGARCLPGAHHNATRDDDIAHTAPVAEVARMLIAQQSHAYRGLMARFFGCVDHATRDALHAHGMPVHTTPQRLARGFARLVDYRQGRELLMQTPDGPRPQTVVALDSAQAQVMAALAAGVAELDGERASRVLAQFGVVVKAGFGGATGVACFDVSMLSVVVTTKSAASTEVDAFGSER